MLSGYVRCERPAKRERPKAGKTKGLFSPLIGRLVFIHLRCWEVLPFLTIQRQRCIKLRVLRAQDFYTPLPLNCQKG